MKNKMSLLSKLLKFSSIDFHIGATLIFRLWSIISGGIIIILIPFTLSTAEQGYFFTFASLIALQIFFELGLNYVIVQFIAHEMAHLKIDGNGVLVGESSSLARVYSLIELIKKWYCIISVLFLIVIFFIGNYFFSINGVLPLKSWLVPWMLLVLFSSINLFISPFFAVLEGMGYVGQVSFIRLIQSICGYTLLSILLIFKLGLMAIPAIAGTSAVLSIIFIYKRYKKILFRNNINYSLDNKISWYRDIFPFQWKIALTWLSGYLIFQLFNPMLFAHQGAIEAGKVGLTLAMFNAMLSLSMSWITAKSPTMARLVAEKNKAELNKLFRVLILRSGILNFLTITGFIITIIILKHYDLKITERISDVGILFVLLLSSIANHITFSMSIYMRAHKEEPMIWNSMVVGLMSLPMIYYFSSISSFLTITSYAFMMIFISLPWCYILFRKYYFSTYN